MNAVTPQPALRRLRSIPSRPSHGNAALGHAGIAGLRRRSLVAALRAASSPFPPSPFHIWVRRAAAEDGAGFSSTSHMRPGRWHAGAKGELRCVVTSAIQDGSPSSSRVTPAFDASVRFIRESAFNYPEDRSLYCEAEDCGKAANREFSARAFDEEDNTSM